MKKYLYIFVTCIVIGLVIAKVTIWNMPDSGDDNIITVERADLAQEVSVTGRVKTSDDLSLAFTKSGRIASVRVSVGDTVYAGETLATLDQSDIIAQVKQAEASMQAEQSKLNSLKEGTRPEEIAIQEAHVASAEVAMTDAVSSLRDKMNSAFTTADDSVRTKADQMMSNPTSGSPQLSFTTDSSLATDVGSRRVAVGGVLATWDTSLPVEEDNAQTLLIKAETEKGNLAIIADFLNKLALALNQATQSGNINSTTLSTWRSEVSTARTNTQTAISNLSSSIEKLRTAISILQVEERTLTLRQAGTPESQIEAQENLLSASLSKVAELKTALANTVMTTPITGLVSSVDAMAGEIATANTPLIRIVSTEARDIEANVPETDIGTVSVGNEVIITLDAFAGEQFIGRVFLVEPAETVIDGVVNFKTTIRFAKSDKRVRSGMTANLRIQTIAKEAVLTLPQYAILENDEGKFVRIVDKGVTAGYREVRVETGIRGPDGRVEVISGVDEGDIVLNIGFK